jgi:hypothetical protein
VVGREPSEPISEDGRVEVHEQTNRQLRESQIRDHFTLRESGADARPRIFRPSALPVPFPFHRPLCEELLTIFA